ncbi:sensor domain-containing diguanylate cyclase [Hydrogenophaga sp. OTU3427]|uniref:sensor domain-containing diguanylate cyclase n=1 Tax=Hydrogenophaga sp. OTU3427 TaxID=3043856 RepID=UPI00313EBB56
MSTPKFRSIAQRLVRHTVWLALLSVAVVLAVQTWALWHQHRNRLAEVVELVGSTHVPLLGVALWDIEPRAVQLQVKAIASWPEIGYVRLRASTGQVFEGGDLRLADTPPTQTLSISAPQGGLPVGTLELVGDPQYLRDTVVHNALQVLLGYGLFTAVVCVLIAVLLRRELHRPLQGMAQFAAQLTPDRLMAPLEIARVPRQGHRDEIDVLAEGFGKLQAGLRGHIANLDSLVAERTRQLEELVQEIHRLSMTDALTGVYNRRSIDERLPSEVERAQRYGRPLAVLFVDLDHFKQINDTHGHPVGDVVLRHMAQRVRETLRGGVDWMARYGGEEFLVVLPETTLEAAVATAERLRECIAAESVEAAGGLVLRVTSSFGVTVCRPGEDSERLLSRVDVLLYEAKLDGRNRVAFSA